MPSVAIDQASTQLDVIVEPAHEGSVSTSVEGTTITVILPLADRAAWLAAYDPSNQYSPSAADSRVIARAVLNELRRVLGEP